MNRFRLLAALAFASITSCATVAPAAEDWPGHTVLEDDPVPTVQVEFSLPNENTPNRDAYDSTLQAAGLPVLIEFYFAACSACNDNADNFRELVEEFHGAQAQLVEVSIDDRAASYTAWIERHGATHPVLNGSDGELTRQLGVQRYPTTVVLDENHEVVWRHVGVWSAAVKARLRLMLQTRQLASVPSRANIPL